MSRKKKYLKRTVGIITLTVKLAEKFLKTQITDSPGERQRTLKDRVVAKYVHALLNGEWMDTGESIVFDEYGRMRDGGHRCEAVIRSGIPIYNQIIGKGFSGKAYKVMNSGSPRTMADSLGIRGEVSCRRLQAALGMLNHYRRKDQNFLGNPPAFNNIKAFRMLDENYDITKCISQCCGIKTTEIIPASIAGFLRFLCEQIDEEKAIEFFTKFIHGTNLAESHPVLALRNVILQGKIPPQINRNYQIALIIKAWNKFIQGKKCKILVWRPKNNQKEKMPRLVDASGKEFEIKI